jgi:two-component system, NarL family, invasion response regulator UvrY
MIRILVIDDHDIVRRGLIGLLRDELESVEVAGVVDGRSARQALAAGQWDLIILDINLPDCAGLDLLQDFRATYAQVPVIVLSAYGEDEFGLRALQLGASSYLSKHRATDELILAVQRVLAGKPYVTAALADLMVENLGGGGHQEPHEALSNRELQVLRMIAAGYSQKEIAAKLGISVKTVSTYRSRLVEKMHVRSNVELTRYAMNHHLVE